MRKLLKIGVVVDQLLAGGVQLAAVEQVKQLNKLGHHATLLILMRKKYPIDFSYLVQGIPYQYLSDSYPLLFRKTIKFPIFSFLSTLHLMSPLLGPRVIKKGSYDILISLGTTTCLTTQAIYKILRIPYIAVIHDPIVYILEKAYSETSLKYFFPILKPIAVFFERSFVKDAKVTLIISRVHYTYLKQNYGVEPKILAFGTKTLNKIPKKRGNTILSFGRWQKEKNPDFLLRLATSIPRTQLIIAGSWINPYELAQFKEKIRKEHLSEVVKLIPHYEEKELEILCRNARLFLHPHFEAFGLAALEAASHGLPIIIPEKSGVTEMFRHGVHGFFPKNVDVNEYKKYVVKLLSDERLAYKMGKAAYTHIQKKHSWEINAKELLQIINTVLHVEARSRIMVLETAHALGTPLAGGDKLMEPMAVRLANQYDFSIIVSSVGTAHWKDAPLSKELIALPRNRFDESGSPVHVFLAYCIRMWQTFSVLKKKVSSYTTPLLAYSSTHILPDVLPAYLLKKKYPEIIWVARVHHLIPPPHKREGKLIINVVSYLMQTLALILVKHGADITIALNQIVEKDLQQMGFLKEKLRILGGGIEFGNMLRVQSKHRIKVHAVFLGRLHIAKGVFDTIPIWKQVVAKLPDARLSIIGDGSAHLREELQEKIRNAHLTHHIKILGYLPYPEVYSIMKQARLFLFLDHEAGWGLAVAEAMACKLPVVGYDIGVLGTIFKSGFIKVPLRDFHTFSDAIVLLLTDKRLQADLAQKAYKEAERFDWQKTSIEFKRILDSVKTRS